MSSSTQQFPAEPSSTNARELLQFLESRKEALSPLLILTHDYPDPDALAAAFSLEHLVEQYYGIEAKIAYGGVIGRTENRAMVKILKMPVRKLRASDLRKYRNIALVDTQPGFKNNSFPGNRKAAIIIDQHESIVKPSAELALVDTGCGATCVTVAQALLLQGVQLPVRVATALAYGILSDTLDLYRARRPDVIQTYLSVLPRCDMKALARIQNPLRSRRFFLTVGKAIREAVSYRRLIVSHLGFIENPDLVSQMAEFLLTWEHIRWSLCTGRYRGKLYVSLRTSQPYAQAGEVLRDIFGDPKEAGGHDAIAGGSFRVDRNANSPAWQQAEQELQARLFRRLRRSTRRELHKPFRKE